MRAGRIPAAALLTGSVLAVAAPAASAGPPAPAVRPALADPPVPPVRSVLAAPPGPATIQDGTPPAGPATPDSPAAPAGTAEPGPDGDAVTAPGEFGGLVTSFGFSVTPATVAPGGTVTLRATGCATQATASAAAIEHEVALTRDDGPGQSATVTVGSDATPDTEYDVAFTCGDEQGSTPLTISGTPATPLASDRAVQNALSGSAGPGSLEVAVGAALVAVAGGLVIHRMRTPRH